MARTPSLSQRAVVNDRDSLLRVLKRAELDKRRPAAERDALVGHLKAALTLLMGDADVGRSGDVA